MSAAMLAQAAAFIVIVLLAAAAATRLHRRQAQQPAPTEEPTRPARTAHDYRVAVAAAERFASASSATVAEWERSFLLMLTAQGLAISTRQATGDAYPFGFALPAEQLGRFFPRESAPYIVWPEHAT